MRYTLFLLCFILNGCWYSNGCFYTPQMVNCVDKGKEYPLNCRVSKKKRTTRTYKLKTTMEKILFLVEESMVI